MTWCWEPHQSQGLASRKWCRTSGSGNHLRSIPRGPRGEQAASPLWNTSPHTSPSWFFFQQPYHSSPQHPQPPSPETNTVVLDPHSAAPVHPPLLTILNTVTSTVLVVAVFPSCVTGSSISQPQSCLDPIMLPSDITFSVGTLKSSDHTSKLKAFLSLVPSLPLFSFLLLLLS